MAKPAGLATLDPRQGAAADPEQHVWLGASAGTGKTQVLSARVLRLMLGGVSPDAILCITFTKAGAAEMAHRIHERLAAWVRMDDGDLRLDLRALGLDWDRPGLMTRARSLFATVIDSPGGAIRVQTIHSFCQTLLASFPLEAKLLPGFRAIEEDEAAALQRQVLADILDEPGDAARGLRDAAAMLSRRLGQDAALSFLSSCAAAFGGPRAQLPPSAHDLRAAFDLPGGDPDAWLAGELAAGTIADDDIRAVATSGANWGTKTGLACSDVMVGWLIADPAKRAAMLGELTGCFLTGKGDLRADFAGDKGKMTDCVDSAVRIVEAAQALTGTRAAMRVADDLAAAWKLGSRFAEAYALAKREQGLADFDDLITLAGSLLRVSGFGEWVRFKLDQRTDHILVDEAQDTNMRQWGIVEALAREFFAGEGAKGDRVRTMFAVGDRKQAIFGFQGTDPEAFEGAKQLFGLYGERAGNPLRIVDLVSNYRSTPALLSVVDAWLAAGGTEAMGLVGEEPPHRPFRDVHAGQVELWQPLPVGKALDAEADDSGDEDGGDASAPASDPASMRLAKAIAGEVQDWIANGKDGRPVSPGDIMILVRRRRDLAARIVARLQALHVPVAGVDRFALTQPLAVRDLVAAMRFAVQPLDDLNLASLLVSPLIGWTQDELYARTHNRGRAALWEHLRATEGDGTAATMAALRHLLGMADFTTPFRFLETVLSGPMDGRQRLYARLGREARDPIDELLNQALAFEQRETVSLLGFLTQVEGSATDIKRQTEARSDVVRVMTVHGSKGLQAPIVILADATDDPDPPQAKRSFHFSFANWDKLPVYHVPKDERFGALAKAYDDKTLSEKQEHWRLFYVAMTRAEEILVVAGVTKKADRTVPETSWHAATESVLAGMGRDWEDAGPIWGQRRVHRANAGKWAKRDGAAKVASPPLVVPDWALRPAPEEARPPRPLAPSALGEDDVAVPPQGGARAAAVERGLLLHALFERLPAVPAEKRHAAAVRWLAAQAPALDDTTRAAMAGEVLAVFDDPAHAALFGPGSLAEVPLSAIVDGMVVAGIVDRLLVTDGSVTVIDYKTGRNVPADAAAVAPAYLRQMAAYRDALRVIFPGKSVEAALLYTAAPRFMTLDDALLDRHKPGLPATKANLPG